MLSPARVFVSALCAAAVLAAAGGALELAQFGPDDASAARHLEADVRRQVADSVAVIEALADNVAAEAPLIAQASASREALPPLFARLATLADAENSRASATVYVAEGSGAAMRVLAWSAGPAEDISRERLTGPRAVFVARGTSGLRLVFVRPVGQDGRAVVTTELALAQLDPSGSFVMATSFGPVTAIPSYVGAGEGLLESMGFVIADASGPALVEVHFVPDTLRGRRLAFRARALAVAALPVAAALLLLVAPVLDARQGSRGLVAWTTWSAVAAAMIAGGAAAIGRLAIELGAPPAAQSCFLAAGALGVVAVVPGGWWWQRTARLFPAASPIRFLAEQIAGGAVLALLIVAVTRLLALRITPLVLDTWQFQLAPFDLPGVLYRASVLLVELALCWTALLILSISAARWRLRLPRRTAILAAASWIAPTAAIAAVPGLVAAPGAEAIGLAIAAAFAGLAANRLREYYRHAAQAMRLLLTFLAILAPLIAIYPITAFAQDRATRSIIERDYAPATADRPLVLERDLEQAEREIDRQLPALQVRLEQIAPGPRELESNTAFAIWSQTSLSRVRAVSDLQLYGPDRTLVSRFALNLPEGADAASRQMWSGTSCAWETFGEVMTRLGAEDRPLLHAERGLCDGSGRLFGAVVVHAATTDYKALPFLSSTSPYYDVLGVAADPAQSSRVPDLQVVVYGWSFQPLFASGAVSWPVDSALLLRLYDPGEPFWTSLDAGGRSYHVYFSQSRFGIYALGYPTPTLLEHATRLAEVVALAALLFLLIPIGAMMPLPVRRPRQPPLRILLHEIRTSFYRKLFLFFVVVAVGPVLVFALAFSAYMTGKFRADVESEAASVVTVARRVFDELSSAGQVPDRGPQAVADDLMVWIREVIDQDVNLFQGPDLIGTSQRSLVESGLLPTRTPAAAYRKIAFDRPLTYVVEDQIGTHRYLAAVAPVGGLGRDAMLSVPLALRQREIERQIDELYRGVLMGSVLVVLFAAGLGASVASRVSDPVSRLTRATRQIARGQLDVRITADTADELRTLVNDFNAMTATLRTQREELARAHQVKAWSEMARQVAHEIKNPLTPIQLVAEHLQRVHEDKGRPLGNVFDQCIQRILTQVRLLRQIASEFSTFAGEPKPRFEAVALDALLASILDPYRIGLAHPVDIVLTTPPDLPPVTSDRTLLSRALTNLVENAIQAMPNGGSLRVSAALEAGRVLIRIADTGLGMDPETLARAFEPYFSTKTSGSGLGLANAKRNIELVGGTIAAASAAGEGTTITVSLPAAAARRDATGAAPAPAR